MSNTDRKAWLAERKLGIGGSDVAAVLGVSPYRTPLSVYEDKTSELIDDKPISDSAYWGTLLEDQVAREFSRRTGMKVQRVTASLHTSFSDKVDAAKLGDAADEWARANIDRAIINPEISGTVRVSSPEKQKQTGRMLTTDLILECKTASLRNADQWGPSQEAEIIAGEVYSEHEIPVYYETQVQWYMGITGAKCCYVAVLIGGQDFRIYKVDRDDELINAIVEQCFDFWLNHVVAAVPPDPVNVEDVKKLYPSDDGQLTEANSETAIDISELRNLRAQIKELEEKEKELSANIITAIGPGLGFTIGGKKAVTYKKQTVRRFDSSRFKADDPETYQTYLKQTETRVLRLAA